MPPTRPPTEENWTIRPPPLFAQQRDRRAGDVVDAPEVGLELAAEILLRCRLDRRHVGVARVVDDHVDAAEVLARLVQGVDDEGGIDDVERQREDAVSESGDQLVELLGPAGGGDDLVARTQCREREGATEPALFAQTPMNLERNVSVDAVRAYKLAVGDHLDRIASAARGALPALGDDAARDLVAVATSLAGTFWQISTPPPEIAALYRADPRLGHALVDFEPRLSRILTAYLEGSLVAR